MSISTSQDGEFVVFVGPSGCGKSTLLRTISGLEEPTAGQVFIGGEDVTDFDPSERGVAMVFQSYALYPHMTVEQNLGFGLRMGGMPRDQVGDPRRRGRAHPRDRGSACAQAAPAFGRPAPARRHRPRHRARAQGLPVRRAAQQPRCRAARPDAHRDRQAPPAARRHHGLCHPRSGRGDDAGRPHRRAARRPHRAAGHADRALRQPRQRVRRRLHRLAAHELHRGRDRLGRRHRGARSGCRISAA